MAPPFPCPTTVYHDTAQAAASPSRPELSAKGKNVLITGGGTGIGAETARYFGEAGAAGVALLGRREQPLLDTKASLEQRFPDVKVFTASTDVTNRSQIDAAFAKFLGDEKLHVVVSNAAVSGPVEPASEIDIDGAIESIQQNLRGNWNVAQAFVRHASEEAVAIEINSAVAHVNFAAMYSAYATAKIGQYRLWDSLAFAHPKLSIYHVQPGIVDTDMNRAAGGTKAVGLEDHVSSPASFNLWLASPEARFLKNKYLWANWDIEELKSMAEELESTPKLSIGLVGWPFDAKDFSGIKLAEGSGWR